MTVDRSPLVNYRDAFAEVTASCGGAIQICEIALLSQLNLRIASSDAALWTDVLGVALPHQPNTVAQAREGWLAWLGPDEWLLVSPADLCATAQRLWAAAQHAPASIVDVSAARTTLSIGGPGARGLLAHGCALDLHPRVFRVGQCAQTRLAFADVIIAAVPDTVADAVPDAVPDAVADGVVDGVAHAAADTVAETAPGVADVLSYRVLVRASFASYLADWLLDAATTVTDEIASCR